MFLKFFVIRWFYIYTPEIIQLYQWFLSPLAGIRKCPWKYLLCVSLSVLLILAVVGLLLWYFCKWIGRFFLDSLNDFCHCMDLVWWSSSCVCVYVAVYYQCFLGKSCRSGDKCLSSSQWCDGVKDCPHGDDESHCCKTIKSTHHTTYPCILYLLSCIISVTSMVAE